MNKHDTKLYQNYNKNKPNISVWIEEKKNEKNSLEKKNANKTKYLTKKTDLFLTIKNIYV